MNKKDILMILLAIIFTVIGTLRNPSEYAYHLIWSLILSYILVFVGDIVILFYREG